MPWRNGGAVAHERPVQVPGPEEKNVFFKWPHIPPQALTEDRANSAQRIARGLPPIHGLALDAQHPDPSGDGAA